MKLTTKWDFSRYIKLFDDKREASECKRIESEVKIFQTKYTKNKSFVNDPVKLKVALDEYVALAESISRGGIYSYYYFLMQEKDLNNAKLKRKTRFYQDFDMKIHNQIEFFTIRISKTKVSKQKLLLEDKGLAGYRHFLENLYKLGPHLLTAAEERIDNLHLDNSYTEWVKLTEEMLSKRYKILTVNGKRRRRYFPQLLEDITSTDKNTRESASEDIEQLFDSVSDIAEHELNNVLRYKKIEDEIHRYKRPDESRHLEDDVDTKTVDVLVKSISSKFSVSKKYYEFKAKMLGVKQLKYHERLRYFGDMNKKYSYEQAANLVHKVFTNLDSQFGQMAKDFFEQSKIDVYPADGKIDGGFCIGVTSKDPVFILVNFTGKSRDVTTLAHELGHAINFELMKKQPEIYYLTSMMTAEVASTFMEDFVLQELLKEVDDETRLAILMYKLDDDVATIFRQTACYEFESELHKTYREKSYLSKREIGEIFVKHMSNYMGKAVDMKNGAGKWWIYWGHIRQFFYVYSYSSGLLISKYLQGRIRDDKSYILKLKTFLEAGASKSPRDQFLDLGVDITDQKFWESGISEVERLLDEAMKLAKKLKKI